MGWEGGGQWGLGAGGWGPPFHKALFGVQEEVVDEGEVADRDTAARWKQHRGPGECNSGRRSALRVELERLGLCVCIYTSRDLKNGFFLGVEFFSGFKK